MSSETKGASSSQVGVIVYVSAKVQLTVRGIFSAGALRTRRRFKRRLNRRCPSSSVLLPRCVRDLSMGGMALYHMNLRLNCHYMHLKQRNS